MSTKGGAPQRLYLMQVAARSQANVPFVCYLVQTRDGSNILIDTGFPAEMQTPPGRPALVMGENVVEQLARLGLQPGDIHLLICTHFDGDHAGRLSAFPNAELVVQRQHYELARSGYPRFAPVRAEWDQPEERYRLVEGDVELLPGLELIETSGHTRGHQSVLVHLPKTGPVLLTIDAVPNQGAFTPDRQAGPMDEDEEMLRASTKKLLALVQRMQISLVIFGHDGEQWQTLKKLPEYYS